MIDQNELKTYIDKIRPDGSKQLFFFVSRPWIPPSRSHRDCDCDDCEGGGILAGSYGTISGGGRGVEVEAAGFLFHGSVG